MTKLGGWGGCCLAGCHLTVTFQDKMSQFEFQCQYFYSVERRSLGKIKASDKSSNDFITVLVVVTLYNI